jgi:Asp-tRNA(Asn)/Glu-tRNA(Gln) amidotransferase A subunit family amidase
MNDLTFATAHQLAQMIRDRQVSVVEVIDAHLAKISRHNAQLNAICTLDTETARTRAQEADLALEGDSTAVTQAPSYLQPPNLCENLVDAVVCVA